MCGWVRNMERAAAAGADAATKAALTSLFVERDARADVRPAPMSLTSLLFTSVLIFPLIFLVQVSLSNHVSVVFRLSLHFVRLENHNAVLRCRLHYLEV